MRYKQKIIAAIIEVTIEVTTTQKLSLENSCSIMFCILLIIHSFTILKMPPP